MTFFGILGIFFGDIFHIRGDYIYADVTDDIIIVLPDVQSSAPNMIDVIK